MKIEKCYLVFIYILIFTLTVFISLAFCEFVARVFHLSKTYNSYPFFVKSKGSWLDVHFPHKNSDGWRDREFTKQKKVGTYRIACIGDSVTEGYGCQLENTFSKVLEKRLLEKGYDVEVMNLGVCGNATSQNLLAVEYSMEFKPDLIIYQFGLNDIEGFEHMENVSADNRLSTEKPIKKKRCFSFKAFLRKSVLYLALAERYNYLKLKMGYRTWAFDEWNIKDSMWNKEFSRIKKVLEKIEAKTKIFFIYIPYDFQVYSPRDEVFVSSRKISKFCKDNGYYFLDFTEVFKKQKAKYGIFLDDCHLSGIGHNILAEHLEDFIVNTIMK